MCSARCLMLIDILMQFCKAILNSLQVTEPKLLKNINTNVMILAFCTLSNVD